MIKCRICGDLLTEENWYPNQQKMNARICKKCKKEYNRNYYKGNTSKVREWQDKYYQNHKEEISIQKKEYRDRPENKEAHKSYCRNNYLTLNGKLVRANKRPYPNDNKCELCQSSGRLDYHHWNDSKIEFGLWLCSGNRCHALAELLDKFGIQIADRYLELKKKIEAESV